MNKNEYRQLLEQVAIVKEPKPKTSPAIRLDETHQNDVRVGNEWVLINKEKNVTLPIEVVKLKDRIAACELGCGDIVTNQVIEKRLALSPQRHWRTRCQNCGCYVSPDGEGFIEGGHQIANAYLRYFNKLKGIETPEQVIKMNPNNNQEYEEIATKDGVIRKYK